MNKKYFLVDGKAIVTNQDGDINQIEYTDKTDDILIKQNLIETMEMGLKLTNLEIETYENMLKNRVGFAVPIVALSLVLIFITTFFLSPLYQEIVGYILESQAIPQDVLYRLSMTGFTTVFMAGLGVTTLIEKISTTRNINNIINARLVKKDYLEERIELENKKLKSMQESQVRLNKPNNLSPVTVNDTKVRDELKEKLEFIKTIGLKLSKLQKLQEQGQLLETLKQNYNDEEIEFIKEAITKVQLIKTKK